MLPFILCFYASNILLLFFNWDSLWQQLTIIFRLFRGIILFKLLLLISLSLNIAHLSYQLFYAFKLVINISLLFLTGILSMQGWRGMVTKIMQSIRITSRPPLRKRKWNQFSECWRTSSKVYNNYWRNLSQGHLSKVAITWSCFVGMKFQPVQLSLISPFSPSNKGQVSTWYLFKKIHRFPWIKKSSQNDEILQKHFFNFFSHIDVIYVVKMQ